MQIERLLSVTVKHDFFLFGARGTGKSTLLKQLFAPEHTLTLDLLNPDTVAILIKKPSELRKIVHSLPEAITHIVIDEIQKIPVLLDVVHQLIEEKLGKVFILTGSSARKLKRGAANLLGGRAFTYELYPFSFVELKENFDLIHALTYGTLPKIYALSDAKEKESYLIGYAHTYLKEEILTEQLIRNLDPFRRFLEVSAQCNGKIINYSNIARDVDVDEKTVKNYFTILEDTLIGFFLEPFHYSFRKRLSPKPKFYYFDVGVARSLARLLSVPALPQTSYFGEVFEHFIILECKKLASYYKPEYRFSYLRTQDNAEIDLIVDRPGEPLLLIEIKSTEHVETAQLSTFKKLINDFDTPYESVCFSRDPYAKTIDNISIFPWQEGIKKFFIPKETEVKEADKDIGVMLFELSKNHQMTASMLSALPVNGIDNEKSLAAQLISSLSLSLELIFKALIWATKQKIVEEHVFSELYNALDDQYKKRLCEIFNEKFKMMIMATPSSLRIDLENKVKNESDVNYINQVIEAAQILFKEIKRV